MTCNKGIISVYSFQAIIVTEESVCIIISKTNDASQPERLWRRDMKRNQSDKTPDISLYPRIMYGFWSNMDKRYVNMKWRWEGLLHYPVMHNFLDVNSKTWGCEWKDLVEIYILPAHSTVLIVLCHQNNNILVRRDAQSSVGLTKR